MEKLELRTDKVRAEMERQGLSEKALAAKIGTSQQLINYWLTSKSVIGVKRLANALGYDAKDLIK